MKLIRLTIKDDTKEFLTELEDVKDIVSDNIEMEDMSEFFGDPEAFIEKYCKYEILEDNSGSKLFLVENNKKLTPDSYDSAVFCAISERTVREMAIELSDDLDDIKITYLGNAHRNIKPGEICSSYNSGLY